MGAPGLQRPAQRRAGAQQVRLSHKVIEGLRAKPIGQRPVGAVGPRHIQGPRPITSTPGGGVNENRSAGNFALREE
jgi:hypothetical protein